MLGEFHAKHVDLYLYQQGLDTTTPPGKAMFQMLGAFSEFERAIIQERIKAGLARARAEGKRLGPLEMEENIRRERRKGGTIHGIAAQLGVGVSVVQRVTVK